MPKLAPFAVQPQALQVSWSVMARDGRFFDRFRVFRLEDFDSDDDALRAARKAYHSARRRESTYCATLSLIIQSTDY